MLSFYLVVIFLILSFVLYKIGQAIDKLIYAGNRTADLGLGVLSGLRVIVNYVLWFANLFLLEVAITIDDYNDVYDEERHNLWWIYLGIIVVYAIYKHLTFSGFAKKSASKYIDKQIALNAAINFTEYQKINSVRNCQKWLFKKKGLSAYDYVQVTFYEVLQDKLIDFINRKLAEGDRIFMYKECAPFLSYLSVKGIQMNVALPENYTIIKDIGFFSDQIFDLMEDKINTIVDDMPTLFSLTQFSDSTVNSPVMVEHLPRNVEVTNEEKEQLFESVIFYVLKKQCENNTLSKIPPLKEPPEILYNKIKPGLIDKNGIYKGEPEFGGEGCVDCGSHIMPEDDEEDLL